MSRVAVFVVAVLGAVPVGVAQVNSIQYSYISENSQVFPLNELTVEPLATIRRIVTFQIFTANPNFIEPRIKFS